MSKRKPTNGTEGASEIFNGAMQPVPEPPVELSEGERAYWGTLFKAKAHRGWCEQDFLMLGDACRARHLIETLAARLKEVDPVADSIVFARLGALMDQAVKRYRSLTIYLQIHPEATQGKSRRQVEQNQLHASAMNRGHIFDDDLIARPTRHEGRHNLNDPENLILGLQN